MTIEISLNTLILALNGFAVGVLAINLYFLVVNQRRIDLNGKMITEIQAYYKTMLENQEEILKNQRRIVEIQDKPKEPQK